MIDYKPSELFKDEKNYLAKTHKSIKPNSILNIQEQKVSKRLKTSIEIPNLDIIYHTKISDYERLLVGGVK